MQYPLSVTANAVTMPEFSTQSTHSPLGPSEEAELLEDLWAEWPYCWAIDLYEVARERFHSFHEKHTVWRLTAFNFRNQRKFQSRYWDEWQRENEGEVHELRLV